MVAKATCRQQSDGGKVLVEREVWVDQRPRANFDIGQATSVPFASESAIHFCVAI